MAFGPLVAAGWLADYAAQPDLRVIDLRWYLDGRSGRDAYLAGHIPGAVFVDLETEITGSAGPGRHPLPGAGQFTGAMRRAGVSSGSRVAVYDDMGGFSAARLWWLLRWFGHGSVAVLDGGIRAWSGELETGSVAVPEGDFLAREPDQSMVLDVEAVLARSGQTILVDARVPRRYRGEIEPIDPRAGHIPGAVNAPWEDNLDGTGRFLPPEELRKRYGRIGVRRAADAVAYCGSGVTACHDLLAMEVAGLGSGRLYEGSWSDWSGRPDLPAASGEH